MQTTANFDKEMSQLSIGVYEGNEKAIPPNWHELASKENKKSGFQATAFYNNGKIVIGIRGSNEPIKDYVKEDFLHLGMKKLPAQYADAHEFYEEIKKDFPNNEIVFTGHSLGGSLAQIMGNETGCETVTFNAYGVGNIIGKNVPRRI